MLQYQARICRVETPVKPLGEKSELSTIEWGCTLASAKVGQGLERQGGSERFDPTSKTSGECIQAAILQPL